MTSSSAEFEELIRLARTHAVAGRRTDALELLARAARSMPRFAAALDAIGALYSLLDEPALALPYLLQATLMEPSNPHYLFNLAACRRMVGDLERAIESCDGAILADPCRAESYYLRSDLSRATPERNRLREMETLLRVRQMRWEEERFIRFALAREYEDIGEHVQSFDHCKAGNDLQRRNMRYDVQKDITTIDEIVATHTREALVALPAGLPSTQPIFVVGLPRTGTTLIERILGSHSLVRAAGELKEFTLSLMTVLPPARAGHAPARGDVVRRSLTVDTREVSRLYVESVLARTGPTPHFIDKMPLNYLYCGLIRAALPNSKLIFVDRHPMDACYAIYKTLFIGAYPFSYDLIDLARYYVAFRRLMQHWLAAFGEHILHVRYEDVVSDFDAQVRRLLRFCELPWEEACHRFHESAAASMTASAVQVRQPVHPASIGKWKHYELQLEPLARHLAAAGIEYSRSR